MAPVTSPPVNILCADTSTLFRAVGGGILGLIIGFQMACDIVDEINAKLEETLAYKKHIHLGHEHCQPHRCSSGPITSFPVGKSPPCYKKDVDRLMMEFGGDKDYNQDGKVYGKHFMFDPKDPKTPPALRGMSEQKDHEIEYKKYVGTK